MELNFYNENMFRAFPFQEPETFPGPEAESLTDLPLAAIVDFGSQIGPDHEFQADAHSVYLHRIERFEGQLYFYFRSDAMSLASLELLFVVPIDSPRFQVYWADTPVERINAGETSEDSEGSDDSDDSEASEESEISEESDESESSEESEEEESCEEFPAWSGYLVVGDLTDLLPQIEDGQSLTAEEDWYVVEPTLTKTLAKTLVVSLNLANDDRTRADAPTGCPPEEFAHEIGETYIHTKCLQGDVRWQSGHNVLVLQDDLTNTMELSASPGAGLGEVCDQVLLFDSELPAIGRTLLEGGPACYEVLRTINGIPGPNFNFRGATGVAVIPHIDEHRVEIQVSLQGLVVCL